MAEHVCTPQCPNPCPVYQERGRELARRWRYANAEMISLRCCGQLMQHQGRSVSPLWGAMGEIRKCEKCGREIVVEPSMRGWREPA